MSLAFIVSMLFNILSTPMAIFSGDAIEYTPSNEFMMCMIMTFYASFWFRRIILWFMLRKELKF